MRRIDHESITESRPPDKNGKYHVRTIRETEFGAEILIADLQTGFYDQPFLAQTVGAGDGAPGDTAYLACGGGVATAQIDTETGPIGPVPFKKLDIDGVERRCPRSSVDLGLNAGKAQLRQADMLPPPEQAGGKDRRCLC